MQIEICLSILKLLFINNNLKKFTDFFIFKTENPSSANCQRHYVVNEELPDCDNNTQTSKEISNQAYHLHFVYHLHST